MLEFNRESLAKRMDYESPGWMMDDSRVDLERWMLRLTWRRWKYAQAGFTETRRQLQLSETISNRDRK